MNQLTYIGGYKMSRNFRYYLTIVTAILFIIFVFMNFIGYWSANRFIQILFFFIMVLSVFDAGIETEKKLKNRS